MEAKRGSETCICEFQPSCGAIWRVELTSAQVFFIVRPTAVTTRRPVDETFAQAR